MQELGSLGVVSGLCFLSPLFPGSSRPGSLFGDLPDSAPSNAVLLPPVWAKDRGVGASPVALGGSGGPRPLALMDGWMGVLPSPARPGTTGPLSRSEAARERPRSLLPFPAGAWLSEQTLRASELQGPPPSEPGAVPLGGTASSLGHNKAEAVAAGGGLPAGGWEEAWVQDTPQRALELVTNRPPPPCKKGRRQTQALGPEVSRWR